MIPASKKVSFTDVPESLTNQLAQTLTKPEGPEVIETPEVKEVVEIKEKPKPAPAPEKAVKKQDREGQINICVPPEVKKEWKILFTKNNLNITKGIIFAIEHLRQEIENDEVVLTVGGVIKKRKNVLSV
jgi:hypothetical protein